MTDLLTPAQATRDAITALKAAGFGKEHGRPVQVASYKLGAIPPGPVLITTEAKVKRADLDDAIVALIVLPGTATYSYTTMTVRVNRAEDAADWAARAVNAAGEIEGERIER